MAGFTAHAGIPYRSGSDFARVAADNKAAYEVIDAQLSNLSARVAAHEKVFTTHSGDGEWRVLNGLGEEVPVHAGADGDWEIVQ